MPTPVKYRAPFNPLLSYHVLFRSIDGLLLFHEHNDYSIFLRQYCSYFQQFFDTLAFSLLSNHTHFIVQVRELGAILEAIRAIPEKFRTNAMNRVLVEPTGDNLFNQMIERQANSFMASYVKIKNNVGERKGGLFQSPFRRSFITSDSHLHQAIIYVHANAQKHGLVNDFKLYPHSSYYEILKGYSNNVSAEKVLNFFGGPIEFVKSHQTQVDHFYKSEWMSSHLEIGTG